VAKEDPPSGSERTTEGPRLCGTTCAILRTGGAAEDDRPDPEEEAEEELSG